MPSSRSIVGFALAAVALLIWSAWFAVTRLSVTHVLRAPDIAALRVSGGALALLPFFLREARRLPRHAWKNGIVLAVCWGAPFALLVALGIQLTSAAHAAALTPSTMPVFAGLMGWVFLGLRPAPRQVIGYAIIVAGAAALTLTGSGSAARGEWAGDAALLGGAAMWATYTVRLRGTGLSSIQAAFLVCLYSTVIYGPIYLAGGFARLSEASENELVLQFLYQGVLSGALAVVSYNAAVARLGARAAVIISLVPVAAALLAIPILGEVPTPLESVAIAIIAFGVLLAAVAAQPRRVSAPSSAAPASR